MHKELLSTHTLLVYINSNYMDMCFDQYFCHLQASKTQRTENKNYIRNFILWLG